MEVTLQYTYKLNFYNAVHTKYFETLCIKNASNKNLGMFWTEIEM